MLDMWQDEAAISQLPQPNEGRDLPATFGETVQDAHSNGQLAVSGIRNFNATQQALNEYMDTVKQWGGKVDEAFTDKNLRHEDALGVINSVVAGMRAKSGDLPFQPMTQADIDTRAKSIMGGAETAHARMGAREQTWGSWLGNQVGSAWSFVEDPYNIPLMVLPLEGAGVIGTAARVGTGMAATQAANEIANRQLNEQMHPGYVASGQAITNVAEAGIGGALLGGAGAIVGKIAGKIAGRFMGTAERDAANLAESERNIAATNPLPGIEGEAAHPAAVGKAIDDILKEQPVDVSKQVGEIEPTTPPSIISPLQDATVEDWQKQQTAPGPQPQIHEPAAIPEMIQQPEVLDAARAHAELTIDDYGKTTGKPLQIPIAVDENGNAVYVAATSALRQVDDMKALADAVAQCALPMAQQAAE